MLKSNATKSEETRIRQFPQLPKYAIFGIFSLSFGGNVKNYNYCIH